MHVGRLSVASVLTLAAGCGDDPVRPAALIPGAYVLATVDGVPVPVLARATAACDIMLTDGALAIIQSPLEPSTDLFYDLEINGSEDCQRSGGTLANVLVMSFGVIVASGSTLRYNAPLSDTALFTGTITAAGLTLDLPATSVFGAHTLLLPRTSAP